jgi:hypothetical protein
MKSVSDKLVDLRVAIAHYRAWLNEQLRACESGRFLFFSTEKGQKIDKTPDQIAKPKELIAEHDRMILGE